MKWILIAVLAVVVVVLLVAVIGWLLPKGHVASRSASLRFSPAAVWKVISGPPGWRPDIKSYQELPEHDGHRMWRETDKSGQTITYEAIESAPPERLVVQIADPKLPFGGTWTYEIAPTADGCTLTITENGEVYNPIFRFVSKLFMDPSATVNAYMAALQTELGRSGKVAGGG